MFFCHFIPLLQQKVYRFKSRNHIGSRDTVEHRKRYSTKLSHKFSKSPLVFKRFSLFFSQKGKSGPSSRVKKCILSLPGPIYGQENQNGNFYANSPFFKSMPYVVPIYQQSFNIDFPRHRPLSILSNFIVKLYLHN